MKPFFPNVTDITLEGLQPAPELGRLLADGCILLGGLAMVAAVSLENDLALPQKQVLA